MWKTIQTGAKYAAAFLHSAAATAAHLIIEYPEELSRVFAFLLAAYVMFGWISSNRNTPAVIFAILAYLLMYPISYIICFIFFLLCSIILRTVSSLYHILFGGHYSWDTEKDTSSRRKTYSSRRRRTYGGGFGPAEEEFYRKFREGGYENFEEFWNAQYGNQSQNQKTEGTRQESRREQRQNTGGHENQQSQTQDEQQLQQALAYFGLSFPFTEEELKTKWKSRMKKAHPDAGGSEEEAKRINQYFDLLKKYAR